MTEWVKCEDQWPPHNKEFIAYVLVGFHCDGIIDARKLQILTCVWDGCKYIENCNCNGYEHERDYIEITHWMPLPMRP